MMLRFSRPKMSWPSLALLAIAAQGGVATRNYHQHEAIDETTVTTTIFSPTTVPVTYYVNVTVPHYVDVTLSKYINTTITNTVCVTKILSVTESTTTTLHYTTSVTETETDSTSITNTLYYTTAVTATNSTSITNTLYYTTAVTETETDSTSTTDTLYFTVSTTETDSATITNTATETTTSTVPATITTYTTQTIFSTTYDPCPKSCSISAETVNLYFWPTNRPYTYPSTYVDKRLGYTFVSPSVYMMIPTAVGVNTKGELTGPSTTTWILPLDIEEVSTIDGSATRQLTISDLGTDCPKTADPTAIATLVDPACNPILAAPRQVRTWAYPCNACGRFGLFDPPYAVPTITGLFEPTTTVVEVTSTNVVPAPTSPPPVGVVEVVYHVNGKPVSTATLTSTGITGTVTSSVFISASDEPVLPTATVAPTSPASTTSDLEVSSAPSEPTFSESSSPTAPVTASAIKMSGGAISIVISVLTGLWLMW